MKKIIKFLFVGLMASSILTACGKDEDPEPAPTRTQILTGTWMTTAITVTPEKNQNGSPVTDWFAGLDPCMKDDKQTFMFDGSYELDNGAIKCDPFSEQIQVGKWKFNEKQDILTITDSVSNLPVDNNIKEFYSRQIVIEYSEFDNKVLYVFRETWTKQ